MKKRIGCKILAVYIGLMIIASGAAVVDTSSGNNALKSNTIIYVPDDYAKIQVAVDSATAGDTIIVRDGTYYENVKVNKRLTIRSENGSAHTIVVARNANDHVFEVTADSVSIKGLTVKDATGKNKMGMYISANHCNITDNTALNNPYGFFLSDSTKNTLINNIASDNLGDGIYLYYSSSNILSNNIITKSNSRNGIRLWNSHSNTLHNNIASKNMVGILLGYSHNNILEKNEARLNNNDGIQLEYSNNNILANNTASANNEIGISLYTSGNCTLTNNMMDGNYYNFGISSNSIYHLIQSIDTSNLVDGKPVYYWIGQQNREIPKDAGFIGIVNSVNITARDLTLTKNSVGILLAYSMLSRIENVSTSNNICGIALAASTNNILFNNTNSNNGIGINMDSSNYNLLAMNRNLNNYESIVLSSSSYNFLTMNDISNSYRNGISLENSLNNIIYLNNFINNPINVYSSNSITIWNFISEINYIYNETAYTSYMGNYWSDYSIDVRGVYIERDTNGDGIGDQPHYICFDKDVYPLTKPFESYIYKSCR